MDDRKIKQCTLEKWESPELINENTREPHCAFQNEEVYSLNGIWNFRCVPAPEDRADDFWKADYADEEWEQIPVPSCWEPKGYGTPYYFASGFPKVLCTEEDRIPEIDHSRNTTGQYRYRFVLPEGWKGEPVTLRFGSVKSAFYCWLNGHYVGFAKGSMLPTEFDVTEFLCEEENILCAEVYQFSDASYLENQDMWTLSGIYRDVELIRQKKEEIRDIHAWAEFSEDYLTATLQLRLKVTDACDRKHVRIRLLDGRYICAEKICPIEDSAKDGDELLISLHMDCGQVKPWSAEEPNLYQIEAGLIGEDGLCDIKEIEFGFRRIEQKQEQLLINGMPLKLRGINYHAFTPGGGYYVPRDVYEKDLKLMKRHNINAIRTSHYPQDDYFYHLCNLYGIYVMDECNVESHGVRDKNVPGNNPLWTGHVVDRMERMVVRDRNHPCVVIWSLGNESESGENHHKMRKRALELDETRPIHYEGGSDLQASDFVCEGYSSVEREQQFADEKDVPKRAGVTETVDPNLLMSLNTIRFEDYKNNPLMATEYMHCMGNSGSDMTEHMKVFEHSGRWCGGFIWDFKDKALYKLQEDGSTVYAYDGDFNLESHPYTFGCNGITSPESRPHEQIKEIKYAYQMIEARIPESVEGDSGLKVEVTNRNSFLNLNRYRCQYQISKDGRSIETGELTADISPRSNGVFAIPVSKPKINGAGEYFLDLSFTLKEDTPWAEAGFELAYAQWKIAGEYEHTGTNAQADTGCEFRKEGAAFKAYTDTVTVAVDTASGNVTAIEEGGKNILKTPLRPAFARVKTDADLGFLGLAMKKDKIQDGWTKLTCTDEIEAAEIHIETDGSLCVKTPLREGDNVLGMLIRQYRLDKEGSLEIHAELSPNESLSRFGMQAELDANFHTMTWLGKGPHDTYPGREESGRVGIYTKDVQEQDEHMRPQEHGNKMGVRWVEFTDAEGYGLRAEQMEHPFCASAWPYTFAELWNAGRIDELPKYQNTTINLDCVQNGLGDAFVKVPQQYVIKAGETLAYGMKLSVVKSE